MVVFWISDSQNLEFRDNNSLPQQSHKLSSCTVEAAASFLSSVSRPSSESQLALIDDSLILVLQIPELNSVQLQLLAPGSLVRYRGMVHPSLP